MLGGLDNPRVRLWADGQPVRAVHTGLAERVDSGGNGGGVLRHVLAVYDRGMGGGSR